VFESHVRIGASWVWTGDHFEHTTPEEVARLTRVMPKTPSNFPDRYGNYANVNGWSSKHMSEKVQFELAGEPTTVTMSAKTAGSAIIDLQRGSRAPERLFTLSQRIRFVDNSEYDRLFPNRPLKP
jgi:hypothetical protein